MILAAFSLKRNKFDQETWKDDEVWACGIFAFSSDVTFFPSLSLALGTNCKRWKSKMWVLPWTRLSLTKQLSFTAWFQEHVI